MTNTIAGGEISLGGNGVTLIVQEREKTGVGMIGMTGKVQMVKQSIPDTAQGSLNKQNILERRPVYGV